MNQSSFWHDRRALVLGCSGFLGSYVVRSLLDRGASVVGLVRDSQPPAERLDPRMYVVRGPADPGRVRSLIAIQQPAVVFQLVTAVGNPYQKTLVTADLLRAVAEQSSDAAVLVPVAPTERPPQFQNRARQLRVGFVNLATLYGPGDSNPQGWPSRLFQAAVQRQALPRPTGDENLTHVVEAAESLLAAAELLACMPEAPANGLRLDPPATTTARELFDRVDRPVSLIGDRLGDAVRETLAWHERQPATRDMDVSTKRAA